MIVNRQDEQTPAPTRRALRAGAVAGGLSALVVLALTVQWSAGFLDLPLPTSALARHRAAVELWSEVLGKVVQGQGRRQAQQPRAARPGERITGACRLTDVPTSVPVDESPRGVVLLARLIDLPPPAAA